MGERSYLSIGDVLSLLREEFPDITISKIRFLESRGLLIPERTPSGYRKFYEHDVDRLRWILRQQRENFLPLKVIKGRLEGQEPSSEPTPMFDVVGGSDDSPRLEPVFVGRRANGSHDHDPLERAPVEVAAASARRSAVAAASRRVSAGTGAITPRPAQGGRPDESTSSGDPSRGPASHDPRLVEATSGDSGDSGHGGAPAAEGATAGTAPAARRDTTSGPAAPAGEPGGGPAPEPRRALASQPAQPASGSGRGPHDSPGMAGDTPTATAQAAPDDARPPAAAQPRGGSGAGANQSPGSAAAGPAGTGSSLDAATLAGASLTAGELAHASGLDAAQVEELESYGLIVSRMIAGVRCYDEDALVVSGLAAGFARFGVEARHLRLFKHAAERQASLYSQIVMPLLRQRNPDARRRAHDDLTRLSELGASMQACFAKAVLRDLTRG